MTPDLLAVLERADALAPRERAMITVLGEAHPDMLSLAQIADAAGAHVHGFGSAVASLRQRRFVSRVDARPLPPSTRPLPIYGLAPRGQDAYRQLQELDLRRVRSRQAVRRIGAAA